MADGLKPYRETYQPYRERTRKRIFLVLKSDNTEAGLHENENEEGQKKRTGKRDPCMNVYRDEKDPITRAPFGRYSFPAFALLRPLPLFSVKPRGVSRGASGPFGKVGELVSPTLYRECFPSA